MIALLVCSLAVICLIILIKYKPIYTVSILGKEIGTVQSKEQIESTINEYILNKSENIAFITLKEKPEYNLKFVANRQTNEEEVLLAIEDFCIITYKMYAIILEGNQKAIVGTIEEAKDVVEKIKSEFKKDLDLDLSIVEIYDSNSITPETVDLAVLKVNDDSQIKQKLASTVNGITLGVPTTGTITSRFGSRSSRIPYRT